MKIITPRQLYCLLSFIAVGYIACAQVTSSVIDANEVLRIEKVLAADDMMGRKVNTPGIEKAADFIASEFNKIGLQPLPGEKDFRQRFETVSLKLTNLKGSLNDKDLDVKNVVVITTQPELKADEKDNYKMVRIGAGANLFREASRYVSSGEHLLVMIDESFAVNFSRLSGFGRQLLKSPYNTIFILSNETPVEWKVKAEHEISSIQMANIAGMLPGTGKKNEYVIFSGHYDHIGVGKPVNGDSIYNGANDDAAGITAVIMLANYYKALGANERTLLFVAFTAEESGGFGSRYFSGKFDPRQVVAMFNIEMIGTPSKWGHNSAYITGYEKTDMGSILQRNLAGTDFTFHPDPYPDQQLFYRSDNATLARLGVPAHTISTSKMDSEPNYHKVTDHVETLDIENMTRIIEGIALSARSIVNGTDTPSRVDVYDLR